MLHQVFISDKEWINSQRIKKLDRKMKIFNEMLKGVKMTKLKYFVLITLLTTFSSFIRELRNWNN